MAKNARHPLRSATAALCATALVSTLGGFPLTAVAEDIDTDPTPDELQIRVEQTAAAYEEAVAEAQDAAKAIDEQTERIAELEQQISDQQARSDAAARELYKFEQQRPSIVDFLLASEGVNDLLNGLDYVNRIAEANVAEVNRLIELKAELDSSMESLEQAKSDADARADDAEAALAAAQEARMEAQRRAEEAARQEAEAAAAAAAAAQAAQEAQEAQAAQAAKKKQEAEQEQSGEDDASKAAQEPAEGDGDSDNSDNSADDAGDGATGTVVGEGSAEPETSVSDGADWSEDQAAFIGNWAPRIDAYLAGSPLAGQGTTFAQAAWNYGVDPRWSPAISCVESSKGAACFLSHNAWGWGSESWGSWEEAIDAHVRGLARGYGYTISRDAAQRYCPPNAQHWYDSVLAQMNLI